MCYLQLVGFSGADQGRYQLLRVEEVHVLVHQTVEDEKSVWLARELVRVAENLAVKIALKVMFGTVTAGVNSLKTALYRGAKSYHC